MHLPQTIASDFKKITYYEKSQGERLEDLVKQKSMLATKCTNMPDTLSKQVEQNITLFK